MIFSSGCSANMNTARTAAATVTLIELPWAITRRTGNRQQDGQDIDPRGRIAIGQMTAQQLTDAPKRENDKQQSAPRVAGRAVAWRPNRIDSFAAAACAKDDPNDPLK